VIIKVLWQTYNLEYRSVPYANQLQEVEKRKSTDYCLMMDNLVLGRVRDSRVFF